MHHWELAAGSDFCVRWAYSPAHSAPDFCLLHMLKLPVMNSADSKNVPQAELQHLCLEALTQCGAQLCVAYALQELVHIGQHQLKTCCRETTLYLLLVIAA